MSEYLVLQYTSDMHPRVELQLQLQITDRQLQRCARSQAFQKGGWFRTRLRTSEGTLVFAISTRLGRGEWLEGRRGSEDTLVSTVYTRLQAGEWVERGGRSEKG